MLKALSVIVVAAVLSSCSTGDGGSGGAPSYEWTKSTGRIQIKDTVIVTGTKDYGWKTVDGSGLSGDGGQAENQEPPFELRGGGKLRKAIADSWPESIHVKGSNVVIENVEIPNVGEDAISVFSGSTNIIIRNCAFAGAEDKILQLNGGGNILIENCWFGPEFKSAIRVKKGTGKVTVRNCTFAGGSGAVVLDPGVSTPEMSGNKFYDVKYEVRKD